MDEYIRVGKTRKTHGIKGGVKLEVEDRFLEDVLKVDVAFLKIQGKHLPFFIEGFDYTNKLIIYFEEIETPEAAVPLTSKDFFIRKKDINEQSTIAFQDSNLQYGKLLGFEIYDQSLGRIGEIEKIMEFPQQEMAQLTYDAREVLIPLNDQLILEIDEKTKKVKMQLPEGLLHL